MGIATGNGTSIGVIDNNRIGESDFGLKDGQTPTVWRSTQLADGSGGTLLGGSGGSGSGATLLTGAPLAQLADAGTAAPPSGDDGGAYVVGDLPGLQNRAQQRLDNGGSSQCVGLVQGEFPDIGLTKTWQEGAKITQDNPPPLQPGTVIATFVDGQYPQSGTERHAAVFTGYHHDDNGNVDGINVIDQWTGQPPHPRTILFTPTNEPQNNAGAFSVVKKR